jgi:hypothetical protein
MVTYPVARRLDYHRRDIFQEATGNKESDRRPESTLDGKMARNVPNTLSGHNIQDVITSILVEPHYICLGKDCFIDGLPGFDIAQDRVELGDFETYFRRELPRLVRSELEGFIEQKMLDDRLVS